MPAHLTLKPKAAADGKVGDSIRLPVLGQGTVGFMIDDKAPFTVGIESKTWGRPAFRWSVDFEGARLEEHVAG